MTTAPRRVSLRLDTHLTTLAIEIGDERERQARSRGSANTFRGQSLPDRARANRIGALGEIALAVWLDELDEYLAHATSFAARKAGDVAGYEAKTVRGDLTRLGREPLHVNATRIDHERVYVLAVADLPRVELVGWCAGWHLLNSGRRRPGARAGWPAYLSLTADELAPMGTLPRRAT